MQNSPEVAGILNKNRVVIVPNGFGMDGVTCRGASIQKGPINYYITSLDSANIYDLFKNEHDANRVAFRIKNKAWDCLSFNYEYFDIFFEKKFLREYKEIFQEGEEQTRGMKVRSKELKEVANLSGKQYALVVGTDNYRGAGWKKLPNAINDARIIRDELAQDYGFEVQLLEDKPMDTIYKAIGEYYRLLQPKDQLILYFAGHGDMETEFMDDGFIVCSDSKSRDDDLARNSYIQYVKLQKMINKIPARQILVMLDVCHGGVFNQKRSDPVQGISNRNVRQFLADQSQYKCRKFLSSVGTEEAFDGKPGDHSPFANLLLQVLRARGSTSNGIVTLSDIYAVLQKNSLNETAILRISPQKDGFGSDNPQSEFILIPVEKTVGKEQ
jgi:Caspase domain